MISKLVLNPAYPNKSMEVWKYGSMEVWKYGRMEAMVERNLLTGISLCSNI
jgi:hypothetical protein